jgi:hypothetical protein
MRMRLTRGIPPNLQKSKNSMSGSEMQKAKESAAEIMRQKQAAGRASPTTQFSQFAVD